MKQFGGDIGVMQESRKLKVHDGKKEKKENKSSWKMIIRVYI